MRVKMSKPAPPAPTVSAVGPCPTIIQIVGRLYLDMFDFFQRVYVKSYIFFQTSSRLYETLRKVTVIFGPFATGPSFGLN